MDPKVRLLAAVPLLAGLKGQDLERIAGLSDEVDLPAGRVVARQGSTGDAFYLIADGTVSVERDGAHLRDLGPGAFFGELALLGRVPRTATVTTTSPARLLVIGSREFHGVVADHPGIQQSLLRAVAERIAALDVEQAC